MTAGELMQIERAYALDSGWAKHLLKDGYGAKMPRTTRRPNVKTVLEFTPMSDMAPTDTAIGFHFKMARMARNG